MGGRRAAGPPGATELPGTVFGQLGFGWRGAQGSPSDGVKVGRQVFVGASGVGAFSGMVWAWDYDAGVHLSEAVQGAGELSGDSSVVGEERYLFEYLEGDELVQTTRQSTGAVVRYEHGEDGRITSRNGEVFAHDPVGWRTADDRFGYR